MLSSFAKWSFTLTAVAPALGAAAIIAVSSHDSWAWGSSFAIAAVLSVAVSYLLLRFVNVYVEESTLDIDGVEQADQKTLEFLLAYLLPVFSATSLDKFAGSLSLTIYSLAVVVLTIVHGNMFQFNPVLSLFGYHFYVVTSTSKIKYLLISMRNYHSASRTIRCKQIGEYMYLDITQ